MYLGERGFSVVVQLLMKQKNMLDIYNKDDLNLTITNIVLDIATLAVIYYDQGSH